MTELHKFNMLSAKRILAATAITMSTLVTVPAFAQDVVLETNDGPTTISGKLISFEDGFTPSKPRLVICA